MKSLKTDSLNLKRIKGQSGENSPIRKNQHLSTEMDRIQSYKRNINIAQKIDEAKFRDSILKEVLK